jgi:hypothetical protein
MNLKINIGFQMFLRTKYVPSLVKIHWKMLILECSQGCYRVQIRPCDLDLRSKVKVTKSILFTAYLPCEHSRINILQWILTKVGTYLVLRRVWNPIDFQGQRSRGQILTTHPCEHFRINIVFTRMLCSKKLTLWHWPLTYDLANQ